VRGLTQGKNALGDVLLVIGMVFAPMKEDLLDGDAGGAKSVHEKKKQLRHILLILASPGSKPAILQAGPK